MSKVIRRINIDCDKAMELYNEGKTDKEIADACYVCTTTVINFRRKFGLECHRVERKKKPVQPKQEKPKKYKSKLAEENAEARRCGMNYGAWKAAQYVPPKKVEIELGKKMVTEQKVPKRTARMGAMGYVSKPIMCVETGVVYPSISNAAKSIGGESGNISKAVRNGGRSSGFHWREIK